MSKTGPFSGGDAHLVTMSIAGSQFGIPVLEVRDVLDNPKTYSVPLAPPEVQGSINLRGRIVTAIDLRVRLRMPPREHGASRMCVIVESQKTGEPYAFLVDEVGDVLKMPADQYEPNPITLSEHWASFCRGLYRQEQALLLVLDSQALLDFQSAAAA